MILDDKLTNGSKSKLERWYENDDAFQVMLRSMMMIDCVEIAVFAP